MTAKSKFGRLSDIHGIDITLMDSKSLCQLLLFGNIVENCIVLEVTMAYIKATKDLGRLCFLLWWALGVVFENDLSGIGFFVGTA